MKKILMIIVLFMFAVSCSSVPIKPDYKAIQFKIIDYETAKAKCYIYYESLSEKSTIAEYIKTKQLCEEALVVSEDLIKTIGYCKIKGYECQIESSSWSEE